MPFSRLGVSKKLSDHLLNQGFKNPFPIQESAIPLILEKRDVLIIAKTGSGKTASYVLPILTQLQKSGESQNRHIRVLVLVPTRELALQVGEVFNSFGSGLEKRIKTLSVYGGVSINPQMIALQGVDILVATPGRLLELIEKNALKLSKVMTLVLDEADKMLNPGFKEEMDRIIKLLPVQRQNLLLSATLGEDLNSVTSLVLNDPHIIKIAEEDEIIELTNQIGYFVTNERKGPLLRYLIKQKEITQMLVFTSSVKRADNVSNKLRINGVDSLAIHSKRGQGERIKALNSFKSGETKVLVATDLLSRGIDIEFLPYVLNYELPRSPKEFIHRIGRTGRAGSIGEAITFVTPEDKHHFKIIQKKMGRWITMIDTENLDLSGY
jgi:ATP-dependent RNA helicase RhlE